MQPTDSSCSRIEPQARINILLEEWKSLRAEQQTYIKEYSPKFQAFNLLIIGAFTFVVNNPSYQFVFVMIPLFMYLIAFVTLSQAHILVSLGSRIRNIEHEITALNGGVPILRWEACVASQLIVPAFPRLSWEADGRVATRRFINPIFVTFGVVAVISLAILIYSTMQAFAFLGNVAGCGYVTIVALLFLIGVIQALSFFFLGANLQSSATARP